MKINLMVFLAIAILVMPYCTPNKPANGTASNAGETVDSLFSQYWEERSRLFPLEATQQGDNRYNSILVNDQTEEFRHKLRLFYQSYATRLDSVNREELNENDQISYDILRYETMMQLEGLKTNLWMIPFQQFWGLPLTMGQLGSGDSYQPFKTPSDYENWLSRLRGFAKWTDSAIDNFRKGMKNGVVLPRVLVLKMIPQMEAMITDPEKSLFYKPVRRFPKTFSKQERERLSSSYLNTIDSVVNPTYEKLVRFLQTEYLPSARRSAGIGDIPQGKETYNYLLKYWTTSDLPADSIYELGLDEVKRIRAEMEETKKEANFMGDLEQFFRFMRSDPRFTPFKTPLDVINAFKGIHQKMEPQLNSLFRHKPRTPFEIRQTEAFRAESASAEYVQGAPDGSRPGIFYIPIIDARKFNITSGMESLFLHEAIPGHHYQISLQQENEDLPKFRRFSWYGAYGEGWALYAESLGKQLGLYTDPFQYMGALGDEMHRAVRLVVDVGIHTKGMTRERAIQFMLENEAISEDYAVSEVERYMAIPGQALSYKVGALKITELRNRYEKQLGRRFDIADFHNELLKDGCMPLSILEQKMDRWVAKIN